MLDNLLKDILLVRNNTEELTVEEAIKLLRSHLDDMTDSAVLYEALDLIVEQMEEYRRYAYA